MSLSSDWRFRISNIFNLCFQVNYYRTPWTVLTRILAIDDSKFSHASSLVLRSFLLLLDLNRTYSKQIYTNTISTNQSVEIRATNQNDEPILASISEVEVKEEPNHEEFIEYPEDEAISRVSPPKKARLHGLNNSNESQDGPGSSDTDPGSSSSGSADSGLFENIYQDCNDHGKYLCNICEKRFSSRSNLQDHKKKNHSATKTEWKCSLVKCKGNGF